MTSKLECVICFHKGCNTEGCLLHGHISLKHSQNTPHLVFICTSQVLILSGYLHTVSGFNHTKLTNSINSFQQCYFEARSLQCCFFLTQKLYDVYLVCNFSKYQYRKSHCGDKMVARFPILVRRHLYIESALRSSATMVLIILDIRTFVFHEQRLKIFFVPFSCGGMKENAHSFSVLQLNSARQGLTIISSKSLCHSPPQSRWVCHIHRYSNYIYGSFHMGWFIPMKLLIYQPSCFRCYFYTTEALSCFFSNNIFKTLMSREIG